MTWRLKLSSTFVYGASNTCVHATANMRTSSTNDISCVDHFGVPLNVGLLHHPLPHCLTCGVLLSHLGHVSQAMGYTLIPLAYLNRRCQDKE